MADNVSITAGTGTSIASDDIGGVQYQRVKLGLGSDGTAVDAVAGAGVVGTGVQRMTLASDDPAVVALQTLDNALLVDDAAFTPATTSVLMIGAQADNSGTDSVDEGDGGALRMSGNRNLFVNIRDNAGNERGLNIDSDGHAAVKSGQAAHDAAIAGVPFRIGARGLNANYAAVSTGDTVDLIATLAGVQIVRSHALPEASWSYAAAASGILNTTTAVTFKTAGAAGLRNYITGIDYMSESLTNATELAIRDGAGGTVLWRTKIPATTVTRENIQFDPPLAGTAATLLEVVTLSASGAGAVYFNAQGYTAP